MNATQLDTDSILFDLDTFYQDYDPGAGLDLETAAQLVALVTEVAAHVNQLRQTRLTRNQHTAATYLDRAAGSILDLLEGHDAIVERAAEIIAAVPAGGRKQALQALQGACDE